MKNRFGENISEKKLLSYFDGACDPWADEDSVAQFLNNIRIDLSRADFGDFLLKYDIVSQALYRRPEQAESIFAWFEKNAVKPDKTADDMNVFYEKKTATREEVLSKYPFLVIATDNDFKLIHDMLDRIEQETNPNRKEQYAQVWERFVDKGKQKYFSLDDDDDGFQECGPYVRSGLSRSLFLCTAIYDSFLEENSSVIQRLSQPHLSEQKDVLLDVFHLSYLPPKSKRPSLLKRFLGLGRGRAD